MDNEESIKIIQTGMAWANWTPKQKEAMLLAMEALKNRYRKRQRSIQKH